MWTTIVWGLTVKMLCLIGLLIVFVPYWPLSTAFDKLMAIYEWADDYLREVL